MKALKAAYMAECAKLAARKKYFVFLCIGAGICILWALLGSLIAKAIINAGGISLAALAPSPMGILGFFLHVLLPFLIFMAVTDLFTVEGAENTMKAMLVLPTERWKLFTAKLLAVMSYVTVYLLTVFAVSAICQGIFGKLEGVLPLLIALVSYIIVLIPLFVLTCFAAIIALLFKGGTLAMFIHLVAYLTLCVLPFLFTPLRDLLFTSYLGWYTQFIGGIPSFAALKQLTRMMVIVFGYGAVFFFGGSLMFDKREY